MNPILKYVLISLGTLALLAVIGAGVTGIMLFNTARQGAALQNQATQKQLALTEPTITTDGVDCNVADTAQYRNYSITLRTLNASIKDREAAAAAKIQAAGGTVTNTTEQKINDRDAGYSDYASVAGTLPLAQLPSFIAEVKGSAVAPDYFENENNYLTDADFIRNTCKSYESYLVSSRATEALYLSQLNSDQSANSALTPISDKSNLITDKLMELRQTATSYRTSIDSTLSQIGKATITISIKEIPG